MLLPLEDLLVLELSGFPGVWSTEMLGDFGADVIKIIQVPLAQGELGISGFVPVSSSEERAKSLAYNSLDRNKRSIGLNLKAPDGKEVFYKLAQKADIVLEGYRPGVAKRLEIDYESVRKINPKLIYCSITGYGQDGPYRDLPGHDINYIALGGLLDLTGKSGGPPMMPGGQIGDFSGGKLAVIGILLALIAREKTGRGQFIDISMTDGAVAWTAGYASEYFRKGILPKRGETVTTGGMPYNCVYETKDRKYIAIGCWEPRLFENLCQALGREDFVPCQNDTGEKRKEMFRVFKRIFRQKTREEWFELLKEKNVGVSPVKTLEEVFQDPQVLHRKMLIELSHPIFGKIKQVGIPIKMSETKAEIKNLAPTPGQHTKQILLDLGYASQQIEEMGEKGVIV